MEIGNRKQGQKFKLDHMQQQGYSMDAICHENAVEFALQHSLLRPGHCHGRDTLKLRD